MVHLTLASILLLVPAATKQDGKLMEYAEDKAWDHGVRVYVFSGHLGLPNNTVKIESRVLEPIRLVEDYGSFSRPSIRLSADGRFYAEVHQCNMRPLDHSSGTWSVDESGLRLLVQKSREEIPIPSIWRYMIVAVGDHYLLLDESELNQFLRRPDLLKCIWTNAGITAIVEAKKKCASDVKRFRELCLF